LSTTSRLRSLYLTHFSQPASSRPIYQAILRTRARRLLELGIGFGERATRMIDAAARTYPRREIEFTGIDLFESRSSSDGPGVTLKLAYRLLKSTGARILLLPGDPLSALSQGANAIGEVDLVVVSARLDPQSLAAAWFYVPRLLGPRSRVFLECVVPGGGVAVRAVNRAEIDGWAAVARRRAA
jgi:hypothetical protein